MYPSFTSSYRHHGNTFSIQSNQSNVSSSFSSSSKSSKATSLSSRNMSDDLLCTFEFQEEVMIDMLYQSVYSPSEFGNERKSKSMISNLKTGAINTALIEFDTNMRKLSTPFLLMFFDKEFDFIIEQLKVCVNLYNRDILNQTFLVIVQIHVTSRYPVCTVESFETWLKYKGSEDHGNDSKFRLLKLLRFKKVSITRQWMRILAYPSHMFTLNSLSWFHHVQQEDKLLSPFLPRTFDVKKSFFNFDER